MLTTLYCHEEITKEQYEQTTEVNSILYFYYYLTAKCLLNISFEFNLEQGAF